MILTPVAGFGAILSFRSLYDAALPTFGEYFAAGLPLLVDLLILGATQQYVAGAKVGRPIAGWKMTAHAGIAATLILNAQSAEHLHQVTWHVTPPAVWAVLVELTGKQVMDDWNIHRVTASRGIPWTLWLAAPLESARTRMLMLRTGITDAHAARIAVGVNAAAREALRMALPDRRGHRVRKIIHRQLRTGSLRPDAILVPLGWAEPHRALQNHRPEAVLQAVLRGVLDLAAQNTATAHPPHSNNMDPVVSPNGDTLTGDPTNDGAVVAGDDTLTRTGEYLIATKSDCVDRHPAARTDSNHLELNRVDKNDRSTRTAQDARCPNAIRRNSKQPPRIKTVEIMRPQPEASKHPGNAVRRRHDDRSESAQEAHQRASRRNPSDRRRAEQQQRLVEAADILRTRPNISGPQMRKELAAKGWAVSDRTAARILPAARAQAAAHRPALTGVSS